MLDIDEIGTISGRINKLVDYFYQGNKAAFGRAADIQSGVLAGIVGGRESKPGFEILQKLLTAYPSVNPTWLLFGQGVMLNEDVDLLGSPSSSLAKDELNKVLKGPVHGSFISNELDDKEEARKQLWKYYQAMQEEYHGQIYTVADKSPSRQKRRTLSSRLAISEKEAERLVTSGRLPAVKISEEEGYRVSEKQVLQFLSVASNASLSG